MSLNIEEIQKHLKSNQLDGWLIADFHGRNTIAVQFLGLGRLLTRRSFYFIPAKDEPIALVNPIERHLFLHLPGRVQLYFGYKMLESELANVLKGCKKIAMEYSPLGRLPYIGLVDAGTIELVRKCGVEIVSSADLVANFQARLNDNQVELHRLAAANVLNIKDQAFEFIRDSLAQGTAITEYDVVKFVLNKLKEFEMETDHGPICAVEGNAGNPHYEPTELKSAHIKKGQLVLLDLWGKLKQPGAVFGDITWVAFTGSSEEIPNKYRDLFEIVAKARDTAVAYLTKHYGKRDVFGADVDDAVRDVIRKAGYSEKFVHRTGHSITIDVHGVGPNIDNLETEDRRALQVGHLFSVEPGIYLEDCGFRSEINVLITKSGPVVTTLPLQTKLTALF
jgi:Xaa-Pro aminopeptidase